MMMMMNETREKEEEEEKTTVQIIFFFMTKRMARKDIECDVKPEWEKGADWWSQNRSVIEDFLYVFRYEMLKHI